MLDFSLQFCSCARFGSLAFSPVAVPDFWNLAFNPVAVLMALAMLVALVVLVMMKSDASLGSFPPALWRLVNVRVRAT